MSYLVLLFVLIIAAYTMLYGIEVLHEKNYRGFMAIVFLVSVVVGLPTYLLFFR